VLPHNSKRLLDGEVRQIGNLDLGGYGRNIDGDSCEPYRVALALARANQSGACKHRHRANRKDEREGVSGSHQRRRHGQIPFCSNRGQSIAREGGEHL
jgi:hypothetical protein